jgi:ATP-dependent Lhr-like helicase
MRGGIAMRWECRCRRGLPKAFLEAVPEAAVDLVRRYARTHGPFTTGEVARAIWACRPGRGGDAESAGGDGARGGGRVSAGRHASRVVRGGGAADDSQKSLARLRKEVEPVEQRVLARLLTRWQGVVQPRRGLDALLDVIENLQGAPLPASMLETEILPARMVGIRLADLDTLIAAGEVVGGVDAIGERDGRVGLYLAEKVEALWPEATGQAGKGTASRKRGAKGERSSSI